MWVEKWQMSLSVSKYKIMYWGEIIDLYLKNDSLWSTKGQTAEARRTTVLQPVEKKTRSQKDRENEKAEDHVPDKGTW